MLINLEIYAVPHTLSSVKSSIVRLRTFVAAFWACGLVVSMFDFHRSDRGSNPGRGGKVS